MSGESFGCPVVPGEATEIDIIVDSKRARIVEMRLSEMEWDGQSASLASLRDVTDRKRTEEELEQTLEKLRGVMWGIIHAMALAVEIRDIYTAGHQRRVANLAGAMAKQMTLSEEQIDGIRMASVIHDLGKISVPAEILGKPCRLSRAEFDMVKTHPLASYDILKSIEFPWPVAPIILQHHERVDGSGYPFGLSGENILVEARLLGVADVVEAMTAHRPYHQSVSTDTALEDVLQHKGTLYDSAVVDACVVLFREKGFRFGAKRE